MAHNQGHSIGFYQLVIITFLFHRSAALLVHLCNCRTVEQLFTMYISYYLPSGPFSQGFPTFVCSLLFLLHVQNVRLGAARKMLALIRVNCCPFKPTLSNFFGFGQELFFFGLVRTFLRPWTGTLFRPCKDLFKALDRNSFFRPCKDLFKALDRNSFFRPCKDLFKALDRNSFFRPCKDLFKALDRNSFFQPCKDLFKALDRNSFFRPCTDLFKALETKSFFRPCKDLLKALDRNSFFRPCKDLFKALDRNFFFGLVRTFLRPWKGTLFFGLVRTF